MKKPLLLIVSCFLVICSCFLIYSCSKKSEIIAATVDVPNDLLEAAKTWEAQQTQSASTLSISTGNKNHILPPNWKGAKLQDLKIGKKIIVVPSPDFKLSAKSTQGAIRKFVYTQEGGTITGGKIVEMFSSADYIEANKENLIENYNNGNLNGFTGVAITYDVNYNYLKSEVYYNGVKQKASAKIVGRNGSLNTSNNKPGTQITTLDVCTDYYFSITSYINGYYNGTTYYFLYNICSGGFGSGNNEYGGNTGTGGSGSGVATGGGGGPGSPGSGGSGSAGPAIAPNVTPTIQPCAGNVVTAIGVLAFSQSQSAQIFSDNQVSDSYGVSDMINQAMNQKGIVFDSGDNHPGDNASTNPYNLNPVTTELQNLYINKCSSLSLARTIIHETMHAYFQYALANYQTNPNINNLIMVNNLLFDKGGAKKSDQNEAQHNQMAQDYIAGMALMLVDYANYAGIQSPDPSRNIYAYCEDMAWGGLEGTKAYANLTEENQIRINHTMFNEQEHNAQSSTQKPCP